MWQFPTVAPLPPVLPPLSVSKEMKQITLLLAVFLPYISYGTSMRYPTIKQLWESADVVFEAKIKKIDPDSYQEDLPDGKAHGLEYTRVNVFFEVKDFIKGSFTKEESEKLKMLVESYYENLYSDILIPFYTAEKTGEIIDDLFPPSPYLKIKKYASYLVYMRRDAFGRLEPVHDYFFLSLIETGYKTD